MKLDESSSLEEILGALIKEIIRLNHELEDVETALVKAVKFGRAFKFRSPLPWRDLESATRKCTAILIAKGKGFE